MSVQVYIPKFSGFCPGVKFAETELFREKEKNPDIPIYVLGDLIHNSRYIQYLEKHAIHTVESISEIPEKATVAIRTHGINRDTEKKLRDRFKVIDLTCWKVKKLQKIIAEYAEQGHYVLITGKEKHPEVQGLISYAEQFRVISTEEQLNSDVADGAPVRMEIEQRQVKKILCVSQTTGSRDLFDTAVKRIKELFSDNFDIAVIDSICSITSNREEEAISYLEKTDMAYVVGDKMSSNANKLYKRLKKIHEQTYFVQGVEDVKSINPDSLQAVLLVSSSSTPDFVEKDIRKYLETL